MMTRVRDTLARDPELNSLPNDGVSQVGEPRSEEDYTVLKWELGSFVCKGEFLSGLDRILSSYVANVGRSRQPAVWISGFYGSGKSHLSRVLQYLWCDLKMPDGATARGVATLPGDIKASLMELDTAGQRNGGLWAAAGRLQAAGKASVRTLLVQLVFRSAGLPSSLRGGQFVLWLHEQGYYDAVRAYIAQAGKTLEELVPHLSVSPVITAALLAADPHLGGTEAEVRQLLKNEFREVDDVGNEDMLRLLTSVLRLRSTVAGKLPCTVVILDELQQFVADQTDRSTEVQEVVESCCSHFGGQLLFVATGQSALPAHQLLSKLKDRFTVRVELSDTDRDAVIREVVLSKKASVEPQVKAMLDQCSGEVDRHLAGSRLAPQGADTGILTADYPLLPTRRRFWDAVLRGVDATGTGQQLRTHLRVVFEGTKAIGEQSLGHVIPADYLYDQQAADMLHSGKLLREVDTKIREMRGGMPDGALRSRLAALVFLVSKVNPDDGLKATADVLADLLVDDLAAGSSALRQQVPTVLAAMAADGSLVQVGEEYRLQTKEGAEWDADFKKRHGQLLGDDVRLETERRQRLRAAVTDELRGLTFAQGDSKAPRAWDLVDTEEPPPAGGSRVPVWLRDGWSMSQNAAREVQREAGDTSPLVLLYIPRNEADQLRHALAAGLAAKETISARQATVVGREGEEAQAALETRVKAADKELAAIASRLLRGALVLQGGGHDVGGGSLRDSVQKAIEASISRLFTRFADADAAKWPSVLARAKEGGAGALSAIGYRGEADQHPACKQILSYMGHQARTGLDIRKQFEAAPYGWTNDAINGALAAMAAAGVVKVSEHGTPVSLSDLSGAQIGKVSFRREEDVVGKLQSIQARKLVQVAGLSSSDGKEAEGLSQMVAQLKALAAAAGGDAPAPPPPDTGHLHGLTQLTGNALILACCEVKDQLQADLENWPKCGAELTVRRQRWQRLQRLLHHARHLPVHDTVLDQVTAIEAGRQLLADPDPVPPLCDQLATALRAELKAARERFDQVVTAAVEDVRAAAEWQRLDEQQRAAILFRAHLQAARPVDVGDEAKLLAALDDTDLAEWQTRITAVPQDAAAARLAVAKLLEPEAQAFKPASASLKSAGDVDAYVDKLRAELMARVQQGPVIIG